MHNLTRLGLAALAATVPVHFAQAQVKVGIIDSLSGPVASIGVPYAKGFAAWEAGGTQGMKIIQIDDTSDPAAAARAAKKLIEEEHVAVLVGSAGTPTSLAIYGVAVESKTPMVITANGLVTAERGAWEIPI